MNEDKYISLLFEEARSEAPQISFEEVSQNFNASLSPGFLKTIKTWLPNWLQNNSLNIILFLVGSALVFGLLLTLSWKDEKNIPRDFTGIAETFIIEPTATQEAKKLGSDLNAKGKESQTFDKDRQMGKGAKEEIKSQPKIPDKTAVLPETHEEQSLFGNQNLSEKDTLFLEEKPIPKSSDLVSKSVGENENRSPQERASDSKKLPKASNSELHLFLLRKYDAEDVQKFLTKLQASGLGIKMGRRFLESNKVLNFFSLRFSHELGLDFELKGTGFQRFEIILQIDGKGQIQSFKYRFNEGEFTRRIPLTCVGYQTYLFGKGYAGKSGQSNVQIN